MIRARGGWRPATTLLVLAAACVTQKPIEEPIAPRPAEIGEPALPLAPEQGLYAAEEALRDVLAGELQYLGTGRWPGVERSRACAFRNDRVLIVNVYCTLNETPAFRIEVYSPERGRVRIYAEANGPISGRKRAEYFTFMTESGPAPEPNAAMRPLSLAMSYEELTNYEQTRYDARLPSCYGGQQFHQHVGGCHGTFGPEGHEWTARNRAFLEHPTDDWYRVIGRMRTLATLYGRHRNEEGD